MSCFEVSATHIDALITAGLSGRDRLRWLWPELSEADQENAYQRGAPWGPESARLAQERRQELTEQTAGRVGAMLAAENRRSVDHRYDENEIEDPYVFDRLPGQIDPVIVLKAIDCYEYQTCEHPEWRKSEAFAFCQALRGRMIRQLPGYDEAPGWEVHDRKVFQQPVATPEPSTEPEPPAKPVIDTRDGKSIRAALKAETGYNARQVSVRVERCTLSHSVNFTIRDPSVDYATVKRFAEKRIERIDRCEYSGEILSGGNTYTHVEVTDQVTLAWAKPYVPALLVAERESQTAGKGCGTALRDIEGLWLFRDEFGYRVHVWDSQTKQRTFEVSTDGPSLVRLASEVHQLLQKRGN